MTILIKTNLAKYTNLHPFPQIVCKRWTDVLNNNNMLDNIIWDIFAATDYVKRFIYSLYGAQT